MLHEQTLEHGNAYLTEHFGPDWFQRIDLATLDMDDGCCCLYSQLSGYPFFSYGGFPGPLEEAIFYGLSAPEDIDTSEEAAWYEEATADWKAYIRERKGRSE